MFDLSLLELVMISGGILVAMAFICCLCCLCMKCSDLKMRCYIIEMAKKKGVKVDLDKLDLQHSSQSPHTNENCAIFVPDVMLMLTDIKTEEREDHTSDMVIVESAIAKAEQPETDMKKK